MKKNKSTLRHKIFLILIFTFIIISNNFTFAADDNISRVVLKNGFTLIMVDEPKMDVVSVQLLVKAGLRQENEQICGISNFIHRLFWKGKMNSKSYFYEFEKMGVIAKGFATPDYIQAGCLAGSSSLDEVLEIFSKKARKLSLEEEDIEEARKELLKEIENPGNVFNAIYDFFRQRFYRYHPYKFPSSGYKKSIEGIDREKIQEFFQRNFIPANMVLSITGNIDKKKVQKKVEEFFGDIPYEEKKVYKIDWEPPSEENEFNLRLGSNISWVFLGYPAPSIKSPDYPAMKVLFSLLGDGISSRMWNELREKRGLAYEIGAIFPELEGPSHVVFYLLTGPDKLWDCQRILLGEIKTIKKYPVDLKELEETKRKVIGRYLIENQTNEGLGSSLAFYELYDLGYPYIYSLMEKIQQVSPADIQRVARFYLNNYTLIVTRN